LSAVRVYIATTQGPSEVQRIAKEDPKVRSVVCLNGTSEALPISPGYDAFVRKPTGVIEKEYGHSVYRVDVSEPVSDGKSWQLGLLTAHALFAAGRLAGKGEDAERAVWLTGEVDQDLNVISVDHVAEKLRQSATLFAELKAAKIPLSVFVHQRDAAGIEMAWGTVVPLERVDEICHELGLAKEKKLSRWGLLIGFVTLLAILVGVSVWEPITPVIGVVSKIETTPDKPSIELTAIEYRARVFCPVNFSSGATLSRVTLEKTDTEHFTPSAWDKLCAVEYGFYNTSDKPIHAWIAVNPSDLEPVYQKLASGENIFTTLVLPRWSEKSLTMLVVAAFGTTIPQQVEQSLAKSDTATLHRAGLKTMTVSHIINPPTKPRFN